MPVTQQDSFIDDSDEFCPLCVEDFDLSDRNFRPCPCGYQICQFCFNNIRKNMNGLCPACRRPYSDDTIEFKTISHEEFRADLQKQNRKKAEQKQKEAQKREQEAMNRKHLSGLRVVQKNLVYVTGLNPRIREEDLLQTLRGEQYFGQYGKIIKIVVNKRSAEKAANTFLSPSDKATGMGVYVTFQKKSDAESCIAAVDGSQNGDRVLRATYGTTKYCSAYLRNEPCPNKTCMFLHEPGEDADSFTRQDLSSFNVQSSQRGGSSSGPPQQQPPVAAAAPPQPTPTLINRTTSYQNIGVKPSRSPAMLEESSPAPESSALPATVSWAAKSTGTPVNNKSSNIEKSAPPQPVPVQSPKQASAAPLPPKSPEQVSKESVDVLEETSDEPEFTTPPPSSPPPLAVRKDNVNGSKKAVIPLEEEPSIPSSSISTTSAEAPAPVPVKESRNIESKPLYTKDTDLGNYLIECIQKMTSSTFSFNFDRNMLNDDEYEEILKMPPLFDKFGGIKRREKLAREREREIEEERIRLQQQAMIQLQMQQISQPSQLSQQQQLQLPPQLQQRQLPQQPLFNSMVHQQPQASQNTRSQTPGSSISQQFNLFHGTQQPQQQVSQQPQAHTSHHTRQSSRYTFNPDGSGVGIKGTNANNAHQHLNQQQIMQQHNQQNFLAAQLFGLNTSSTSVQAPPPGLKSAPTPPALMNMYGQQGFGLNLNGAGQHGVHMGHAKSESQDLLQLMRGGTGKHLADPSILQARLGGPQQHPMQHQLNGLVSSNQQGGYANIYYGGAGPNRW